MDVTATMDSYRNTVAQMVSQAAIHLHNTLGPIGTALYDQHGTLILNNNALRYANDNVLTRLVFECANGPIKGPMLCRATESVTLYAVQLDAQHVFVVVGSSLDEATVDGFLSNLRRLLPPAPKTDD